jgi:hypothetical protein
VRTLKYPKPPKRGPKPPTPLRRRLRPRSAGVSTTHQQRVRACNKLWRLLIYAKAPSGVCPRCLKRAWSDAAHCFTKGRYPHIRFEIDNGAPLCRVCHRIIDSDHLAKREFFERFLGPAIYAALELRAQSRGKADLMLVEIYLRSRVEEGARRYMGR